MNLLPIETDTEYSTGQDEFMLAMAVENYDTGVALSDPRYVRWVTTTWEKKDNVWIKNTYLMHRCTEEDFARFYPDETEVTSSKIKVLREGKHLFCLDWKALAFSLIGSEKTGLDFKALDPMLIPCGSEVKLHDGSTVGGKDDDCIWGREEMKNYMSAGFNLYTYQNQQKF